jgi:hypothetical protein
MKYHFYAEDGSTVSVGPVPAEGLDSGDKATNKALSAALKYALIQTFSIPTEDMAEADLDSPEIGTAKSKPEPVKAEIKAVAPTDVPVKETAAPAKMEKPKFAKPKATKSETAPETTEGGWE